VANNSLRAECPSLLTAAPFAEGGNVVACLVFESKMTSSDWAIRTNRQLMFFGFYPIFKGSSGLPSVV
jgi:hypothetical protein